MNIVRKKLISQHLGSARTKGKTCVLVARPSFPSVTAVQGKSVKGGKPQLEAKGFTAGGVILWQGGGMAQVVAEGIILHAIDHFLGTGC